MTQLHFVQKGIKFFDKLPISKLCHTIQLISVLLITCKLWTINDSLEETYLTVCPCAKCGNTVDIPSDVNMDIQAESETSEEEEDDDDDSY